MGKQLTTTNLIIKVCQKLGVEFSKATKNSSVLELKSSNGIHFIINSNLGLISSTQAQLCIDKAYQYEILNQIIASPKTISYLDPYSQFGHFAKIKSHKKIIADIKENFSFPIVLKKNTGSEGQNIFLCKNENQLTKAVANIFDQNHHLYDHVLLAQDYIEILEEYRAIFYKHQLELLYKKDNSKAVFTDNLSPLHFKGSKAFDIKDKKLFTEIENFIKPIFTKLDLAYAGYDIAKDKNDKLWLIEINSSPGFSYYLRDNEEKKVFDLFEKIISDLATST